MSKLNKKISLESLNEMGKGLFPEYMGVEILEVRENFISSRLKIMPHHLAPNRYLHAGTVVTLADTTCGYGSFLHLPEGAESLTTIELKSNFLGTAREGAIYCEATGKHLGRNTHVWDAEVKDEKNGRVIALFRCTQMILYPRG